MRREDIARSHYQSFISASIRFGVYIAQEERDDGYLIIEQCLADGFRSARCGRRRCEWGRLIGHCVVDGLQHLLAVILCA